MDSRYKLVIQKNVYTSGANIGWVLGSEVTLITEKMRVSFAVQIELISGQFPTITFDFVGLLLKNAGIWIISGAVVVGVVPFILHGFPCWICSHWWFCSDDAKYWFSKIRSWVQLGNCYNRSHIRSYCWSIYYCKDKAAIPVFPVAVGKTTRATCLVFACKAATWSW